MEVCTTLALHDGGKVRIDLELAWVAYEVVNRTFVAFEEPSG